MSLFLSEAERESIRTLRVSEPVMAGMYWALLNRVDRRAASPALGDIDTTTHWWHHASEYLTDAAMALAIHYKPPEAVSVWLRAATLAVVHRPVDDWIGPAFRDHSAKPPVGNLETAHLTWSVAIVLDLVPHIFTSDEREEITTALREKGIALCREWVRTKRPAANWRCILNAGVAVAGAVLNDAEAITSAVEVYAECSDFFQTDGSYGESLQYGNYALYGLMLAREALLRRDANLKLPLGNQYRKPTWDAQALFYRKPLSGWGAMPLARSANFNDSAAIHRSTADVLLHIAARGREKYPQEAGLARWLFDTLYLPIFEHGHHDRASFGFMNDFGFLSLLHWPTAANPIAPTDAGLALVAGFGCGDAFARDAWNGRTVLAMRSGAEPLRAMGHAHGDYNSFILVHNQERLLVDPGHSCYRNAIHELECASAMHNTCTFHDAQGRMIQQHRDKRRRMVGDAPVDNGTRRLLLERVGDVSVVASESASMYGEPITAFTRCWILCGSNVLFIVDRVTSSAPVRTNWNFLLNNRDDLLDLKQPARDRIVARRGAAGMKLFHLGGGSVSGPTHAFVHDAYHPLPNQLGEGRSGSGALLRWSEPKPATDRTVVHAIAIDDPGSVAGWHLKVGEPNHAVLESPGGRQVWKLLVDPAGQTMTVEETVAGRKLIVSTGRDGAWRIG